MPESVWDKHDFFPVIFGIKPFEPSSHKATKKGKYKIYLTLMKANKSRRTMI